MKPPIATLFIFASESNPAKTYQTLQYTDGSTSCECPAWKFKTKTSADGQRTCKHTRFIDAGQASRHAITVTEYAKVARRTPQPTIIPAVNITGAGNTLLLGRRAIQLEDE